MRRFLRAPAISLTSQALGLAQLGLILFLVGAGTASDAYFYLFGLGLVPILIVLVGLMYPMLLNEHRITRSGIRVIRTITPISSVLAILGGSAWLDLNGRLPASLLPLIVLLIVNSVIQAATWFRAVLVEAAGNASWISGVALPANALACVALSIHWPSPSAAISAMASGLLLGNAGMAIVLRARRAGQKVLDAAPTERGASRRGVPWFLGKASVGYASQVVLQSIAVQLPAANLTFLNIANKVVGSISASFVNAIMPNFVHRDSGSRLPARNFLHRLLVCLGIVDVVAVGTSYIWAPGKFHLVAIGALWVLGSTGSAVAQRMAFRFLPSGASRISIVTTVVVVALAVTSASAGGFNLNVLLAALAAIDVSTAMFLLWLLADRTTSIVMACCLVGLGGAWASALTGGWIL